MSWHWFRYWYGAKPLPEPMLPSSLTHIYGHDDVIKWKHFPRYWPFVWGIHRSPVNSPYKGQWRGALMFSLICVWINGWVNNREAGDLRRYRAHYGVIVMRQCIGTSYLSPADPYWRFDRKNLIRKIKLGIITTKLLFVILYFLVMYFHCGACQKANINFDLQFLHGFTRKLKWKLLYYFRCRVTV